jgi:hypothetical protein
LYTFQKRNTIASVVMATGWFDLSTNYPTGSWTTNFLNNVLAAAVPEPGTNVSIPSFLSPSQVRQTIIMIHDNDKIIGVSSSSRHI